MEKYSRQRECILADLQGRCDHPTADMIYESVRLKYPHISLGTVYRNLALLAESGRILRITTGSGPEHFDGCIRRHHHFICRCCGEVTDLSYEPEEKLAERASQNFDGEIADYELQFFGRCKKCVNAQ